MHDMALTADQRARIGAVIKEILLSRIESFPDDGEQIRNAPFHGAILRHFEKRLARFNVEAPHLVAIASWLHGLNTSLGTGFEHIAHILSGGRKEKFSGSFRLRVKKAQTASIEQIIRDLKAGVHAPNLRHEDDLLSHYRADDEEIDALDFTVDAYIEKPNEIIAIELKSVRPNSGEGRGEKQKILYGKAALRLRHPDKTIRYFVGFPFDPTSDHATAYDTTRFFDYLVEFKKFFAEDEVLIASALWDFLSGQEKTMEEILQVIEETVSSARG